MKLRENFMLFRELPWYTVGPSTSDTPGKSWGWNIISTGNHWKISMFPKCPTIPLNITIKIRFGLVSMSKRCHISVVHTQWSKQTVVIIMMFPYCFHNIVFCNLREKVKVWVLNLNYPWKPRCWVSRKGSFRRFIIDWSWILLISWLEIGSLDIVLSFLMEWSRRQLAGTAWSRTPFSLATFSAVTTKCPLIWV